MTFISLHIQNFFAGSFQCNNCLYQQKQHCLVASIPLWVCSFSYSCSGEIIKNLNIASNVLENFRAKLWKIRLFCYKMQIAIACGFKFTWDLTVASHWTQMFLEHLWWKNVELNESICTIWTIDLQIPIQKSVHLDIRPFFLLCSRFYISNKLHFSVRAVEITQKWRTNAWKSHLVSQRMF